MQRKWMVVLMVGGVLAACNQKQAEGQVVRGTPETSEQIETVQYEVYTESESSRGDALKMPAYKIAYMFDQGTVTARLDLPGEMSPDGKARILVADMEGRKSRQLFADTLQPDPGFDAKYFSKAMVDTGVFNDLTPKRRLFVKPPIILLLKHALLLLISLKSRGTSSSPPGKPRLRELRRIRPWYLTKVWVRSRAFSSKSPMLPCKAMAW